MSSPPLTNREYAYFKVVGLGNQEVITERLGWEPSNAWSVGDKKPRGGVQQWMFWTLNSGHDDTKPLDTHIESLLLTLEMKAETIRQLSMDYELTIQCVGYYPASGHGANLNREVIRRAAQLGLAFDLDFYYIDNHDEDE